MAHPLGVGLRMSPGLLSFHGTAFRWRISPIFESTTMAWLSHVRGIVEGSIRSL